MTLVRSAVFAGLAVAFAVASGCGSQSGSSFEGPNGNGSSSGTSGNLGFGNDQDSGKPKECTNLCLRQKNARPARPR